MLGSVALADDIRGTFGKDDLPGTNQMDRIHGLGAADIIEVGRNDDCYGAEGFDDVSCGNGNDRIDGGFGRDICSVVPAMTRSSLRTVEWMILTLDLATTQLTSMSLTTPSRTAKTSSGCSRGDLVEASRKGGKQRGGPWAL